MATEITFLQSGSDPLPYHVAEALTALVVAQLAHAAAVEQLARATRRRDEAREWHDHTARLMTPPAPPAPPVPPQGADAASPVPPAAPGVVVTDPTPPAPPRRPWWRLRRRQR